MCILGNKPRSSAKAARFEPLICLSRPFISPVNSTSPKYSFVKPSFNLPPVRPFSLCFRSFASASSPSSGRTFFKFFIEKVLGTNSLHFCLFSPLGVSFCSSQFCKAVSYVFVNVLRDIFYEDTGNIFSSFSGTYCLRLPV